jgi:F-type H+-transporting ATPase subunit b
MALACVTPLLLAEGGASGGGLTDVNGMLFLFTLVLFSLFAAVLAKFGWKPLLAMIEEREKGVREAVEGAQRANAEAQALLARHQELLRNTGREREEILKKAVQEAEKLREELVVKAQAESDGLVARARAEIEQETRRALVEIRLSVADLAVDAAAKIVTSSMSPEAQKKLVDEFVSSLPPLQ